MDRIDLHVEVPRVKFDKLSSNGAQEASKQIKERIEKARRVQLNRFKDSSFITNSEMSSEAVKRYCPVDEESKKLLKNAVDLMHLSARGYFRVLKTARTIADLDGFKDINSNHIAEALQYRPKLDQ
jgi:magnesium chelatase family protein